LAANFNNIMDMLQLVFGFVNAPLFATFLLGMFWKRATGHGAFFGLLGGMLAAAAMPMLAAGLPGLGIGSPVVYALVPLVLLIVSAIASYVPARRAAGLDPLRALRNE